MSVYDIAILGDSLTVDRNARNWPILLERELEIGKASRVRTYLFGEEGTNSNTGIANWPKVVAIRPKAAVIAYINDANPAAISLAVSASNTNAMIDALQAASPTTLIFVAGISRPLAADAAATFPNLAALDAQLASIATAQGVGFIDGRTAWGDPALNSSEYAVGDGIHPLLAGHLRVTIPLWKTTFSPLIT
jgi:lysophospholipase L1-like esterase